MNEFEKEEMKKSRPVVKSKLCKLRKWLDDHVPKPIKNAVDEAFLRLKNSILRLYDGAKKTLKDIVEKEAEEEQQQEEDIDLTPHEHERELKRAYRSFVIPGAPKTDIDSYFDQTKPHIKTFIKNQLREMGSAKIIMTLWVVWKKPLKLLIKLDPEDKKMLKTWMMTLLAISTTKRLRCHLSFLKAVISMTYACIHQGTD